MNGEEKKKGENVADGSKAWTLKINLGKKKRKKKIKIKNKN